MLLTRKWIGATAAALVAAILLAAYSPSKPAGKSAASGGSGASNAGSSATTNKTTVTIATTTDVVHFNPLLGISQADFWTTNLMYPALMSMNTQGTKIPSMATKWGYTSPTAGFFDVRSDIKWSDGVPLTASDVAWELNAIAKYKPAGIITGFMNNFGSAKATSKTHVAITLSKPDSTLIPEVGFWMRLVPEHVWDKVGNIGTFANNSNWVGAGPYILKSYTKGQSYTLRRVNSWPLAANGVPTMQTVVFRIYADVNTELLALKAGDVDIVGDALPPTQVASLKSTSGVSIQDVPRLGYSYISFNVKHSAVKNPKVRLAIAHAIDNATIRKVVVANQALSTNSELIAPVLKQWVDPDGKEFTYDPNLSKSLIEQAGYKMSGGKFPITVNVLYSLVDPLLSQAVPIIRDELGKVGITVNAHGFDANTTLQKAENGDFDMYVSQFLIEDNPVIGMLLAFEKGGANNFTFEDDPGLLSLIGKAQNSTSSTQQIQYAREAAQDVKNKAYVDPLFMQNVEVAYRTGWSDFVVEPSQLLSIINPTSLSHIRHTG